MDFLISYIAEVLMTIKIVFGIIVALLGSYIMACTFDSFHKPTKKVWYIWIFALVILIFTPVNIPIKNDNYYIRQNAELTAENVKLKQAIIENNRQIDLVIEFLKENNLGDKYVQFAETHN